MNKVYRVSTTYIYIVEIREMTWLSRNKFDKWQVMTNNDRPYSSIRSGSMFPFLRVFPWVGVCSQE